MYEQSRIDPLDSRDVLNLDRALLERYPPAYRHLAYFQVSNGARVPIDLPTPGNASFHALTAEADAWLAEMPMMDSQPATRS